MVFEDLFLLQDDDDFDLGELLQGWRLLGATVVLCPRCGGVRGWFREPVSLARAVALARQGLRVRVVFEALPLCICGGGSKPLHDRFEFDSRRM